MFIPLTLVSSEKDRAKRSALINKIKLRFGTQGSPMKNKVITPFCFYPLVLFPIWSARTWRIIRKTWKSWSRWMRNVTSPEMRINRPSGNISSAPSTTRPILTRCVAFRSYRSSTIYYNLRLMTNLLALILNTGNE